MPHPAPSHASNGDCAGIHKGSPRILSTKWTDGPSTAKDTARRGPACVQVVQRHAICTATAGRASAMQSGYVCAVWINRLNKLVPRHTICTNYVCHMHMASHATCACPRYAVVQCGSCYTMLCHAACTKCALNVHTTCIVMLRTHTTHTCAKLGAPRVGVLGVAKQDRSIDSAAV